MPTAPSVPTYPPEQLRSHQARSPRERYSSDPSDSRPPPTLVSHKQAEHHPDLQPEPPQVQPSSFVSQTPSQMCESVSDETAVQPSQVEPEGPSYLSISLAALLSETPSSMGSKFDPYRAAMSESVLAEINNMVRNLRIEVIYVVYLNVVTVSLQEPLQQPEQSQQPQKAGPSPWPDLYELGAKPFLSPVQSPSTAQVPLLGTQPVGTSPPSQLPLQPLGMPQPVGTSPHSQPPLQAVGLPQSSQHPPALASTFTVKDPGTGPQQDYAAKATKFLTRVQQVLRIEDIRTELTQGNYKEKMHKLLCWEEKAHIEILGNR